MKLLGASLVLLACTRLLAQQADSLPAGQWTVFHNERYGPAEKNTLDILLPASPAPSPLAIFIHGGGFVGGDKSEAFTGRVDDVLFFLNRRIAFASLNYRFLSSGDSVGVGKCLDDITTALQFIRHNAARYHIDKRRVACYGSSAGAGSSLYLAFHDDMAVPGDTSLRGESTRLRCAGALSTQATFDILRWQEFIPGLRESVNAAKDNMLNAIANFYGYPDYPHFQAAGDTIPQRYDMLKMISPDDPPVYIMNLQRDRDVKTLGLIEHHPAHAEVLDEYLKREHIPHTVYVRSDSIQSESAISYPVRVFLAEHLEEQASSRR